MWSSINVVCVVWMKITKMKTKKNIEDSDSDETQPKKEHYCPICNWGPYLHPRSVHKHVVRQHPNYKKLYQNKVKGKIKYTGAPKKKCPYCNVRENLRKCSYRCPLYSLRFHFKLFFSLVKIFCKIPDSVIFIVKP